MKGGHINSGDEDDLDIISEYEVFFKIYQALF